MSATRPGRPDHGTLIGSDLFEFISGGEVQAQR
jgi:hypothetical protein